MKLTTSQTRHLRSQAHKLKPVVMVGAKGITDSLLEELEIALNTHELIKVKVSAEEREDRDKMIEQLCKASNSVKVQRVGHIVTLFRRNKNDPKVELPK